MTDYTSIIDEIKALSEKKAATIATAEKMLAEAVQEEAAAEEAMKTAKKSLDAKGYIAAEDDRKRARLQIEMYKQNIETSKASGVISETEYNEMKKNLLAGIAEYEEKTFLEVKKHAEAIRKAGQDMGARIDEANNALQLLETDLFISDYMKQFSEAVRRFVATKYSSTKVLAVSNNIRGID